MFPGKIPTAPKKDIYKIFSYSQQDLASNRAGIKLSWGYKMPLVLDNWGFLQQEQNSRKKSKPSCWKAPTLKSTRDGKAKGSFQPPQLGLQNGFYSFLPGFWEGSGGVVFLSVWVGGTIQLYQKKCQKLFRGFFFLCCKTEFIPLWKSLDLVW